MMSEICFIEGFGDNTWEAIEDSIDRILADVRLGAGGLDYIKFCMSCIDIDLYRARLHEIAVEYQHRGGLVIESDGRERIIFPYEGEEECED